MLECGPMSHDQKARVDLSRSIRVGVLRTATWLGALAIALMIEHFVVHRGVIVPAVQVTGSVPIWAWAALYAPELIACFIAGWQLRSWTLVGVYAVLATILRERFYLLLHLLGEPGHQAASAPRAEFTLAAPIVAVAYGIVLVVASLSSREDAELDGVS
jgi:hypothetical protein